MTFQTSLFPESLPPISPAMPDGFRYQSEIVSRREETALAAEISALQLKPYEFRGFYANRNVTAFGFRYDYKTRRMERAADFPPFLEELRTRIATFAKLPAADFRQVLVTEYVPGTALAWHRDRLQYGEIVGVSLLSPANFRVRKKDGDRWRRASQIVEPRSVYVMAGEVRMDWEHSIPAMETLRYSLTFRTFAETFTPPDE